MVENKGKRASSCRGLIQIQMDDQSPNLAISEPKPHSLSGCCHHVLLTHFEAILVQWQLGLTATVSRFC